MAWPARPKGCGSCCRTGSARPLPRPLSRRAGEGRKPKAYQSPTVCSPLPPCGRGAGGEGRLSNLPLHTISAAAAGMKIDRGISIADGVLPSPALRERGRGRGQAFQPAATHDQRGCASATSVFTSAAAPTFQHAAISSATWPAPSTGSASAWNLASRF